LQRQLLAPGACFSDQRPCDLSGVVGEDRDLHHVTFVGRKFGGESRVEVRSSNVTSRQRELRLL